jgi:hypothetical protein
MVARSAAISSGNTSQNVIFSKKFGKLLRQPMAERTLGVPVFKNSFSLIHGDYAWLGMRDSLMPSLSVAFGCLNPHSRAYKKALTLRALFYRPSIVDVIRTNLLTCQSRQ